MTERSLIPAPSRQLAKLETAGKQLSIAARLSNEVSTQRWVAFLQRIKPEFAIAILSGGQDLNEDLLRRPVSGQLRRVFAADWAGRPAFGPIHSVLRNAKRPFGARSLLPRK